MPNRQQSTRRPARPHLFDPERPDLPQGFRESALVSITHRPLNRALRTVANIVHEMSLECADYWPELPGPFTGWEMRAALGDLQHLQHFLARIGRERMERAPVLVHARLSAVAEAEAVAVGAIVERIHRELQAAGVEHWHEEMP